MEGLISLSSGTNSKQQKLITKEIHVTQKKGFVVINHGNSRNELMVGIESWRLLQSLKAIETQEAKHKILF